MSLLAAEFGHEITGRCVVALGQSEPSLQPRRSLLLSMRWGSAARADSAARARLGDFRFRSADPVLLASGFAIKQPSAGIDADDRFAHRGVAELTIALATRRWAGATGRRRMLQDVSARPAPRRDCCSSSKAQLSKDVAEAEAFWDSFAFPGSTSAEPQERLRLRRLLSAQRVEPRS
jgi:hypothetical protein